LGNLAIAGHQASIKLENSKQTIGIKTDKEKELIKEWEEIIEAGNKAEELICDYNDYLGIVASKYKKYQSSDPSVTKKSMYTGMYK
jgi:hypothetical protein